MNGQQYSAMHKILAQIEVERLRQVTAEGYDPAHDDAHTDGALALAAAPYIGSSLKVLDLPKYGPDDGLEDDVDVLISMSPWSIRFHAGRNSLIKAAALLIAEIERRDRAAQ